MEYPFYVGGEPVKTARKAQLRLPYDGSPIGEVFLAGPEQLEAAVAAARAAAPLMAEMTPAERAELLTKAHHRLLERREELALRVSSESGKPIREARLEVERAAQTLLFSAQEARRLRGEVVPMEGAPAGKDHWAITVREPLGVVAAITPFNFPLNLALHKIGPALAAGNAMVHKPASATPLSALLLAEIFQECGLPAGALNVIPGPGGELGDLLSAHPDIAMVSFTGSPEVGARIRSLAGMKRVTLELGNNSALIVDEDAALEEAAARAVPGSFANSGQVCISIQRIYVHRRVREEFLERFLAGARRLKIGHPHDPSSEISSLISEAEARRVEEWIAEAVQAGARLLSGGARRGATMEPTVLAEVPPHVRLCCREVFGPVVGVNCFDSLEEALELVNRSEYGLQAGIYTRDISKAFRAARRLRVGGVMINEIPQYRVDHMPYGGVKLSGTGREGPKYAIEEMTEPKLICWKV